MRVGIVGAAGTGKSTLAADLSKALGVPLIPDFTLDVLKEQVGKPSWRGIKDTRIRRTIRLEALEKKIKAETAAESFVSDKTVFDYLTYWLQNQAEFEIPEQTHAVVEMVKGHVARYERCIFLPYRPVVDYAEDRSTDPIHNMKVAGLKRGLLTVLEAPVIDAPYTFGEDLGAWVARYLTPAKGAGAGAAAVTAAEDEAGASPAKKKPAARAKAKPAKKKA